MKVAANSSGASGHDAKRHERLLAGWKSRNHEAAGREHRRALHIEQRLDVGKWPLTAENRLLDPKIATDSLGSASVGRARDLTAGKLTPNLSDRIADVRVSAVADPQQKFIRLKSKPSKLTADDNAA